MLGGTKELVCLENYFSKSKETHKYKTISLEEILKMKSHTSEEKEILKNISSSIHKLALKKQASENKDK